MRNVRITYPRSLVIMAVARSQSSFRAHQRGDSGARVIPAIRSLERQMSVSHRFLHCYSYLQKGSLHGREGLESQRHNVNGWGADVEQASVVDPIGEFLVSKNACCILSTPPEKFHGLDIKTMFTTESEGCISGWIDAMVDDPHFPSRVLGGGYAVTKKGLPERNHDTGNDEELVEGCSNKPISTCFEACRMQMIRVSKRGR